MAQDIYGRKQVVTQKPITADMCTILWPGASGSEGPAVTAATNVSITYQQQVTRRRTLGAANNAPLAVIYPSQPQGSMSIQRLISEKRQNLFARDGWTVCKDPATIKVSFDGETAYPDCAAQGDIYTISGAIVTSYSLQAEAESLTVVDNINIEFLQMEVDFLGS